MHSLFSTLRSRFAGPSLLGVLACAVLLAGCSDGGGHSAAARAAKPAVPVHVKTVEPGKVPVYSTYPARIHGRRSVHVVSRVEGFLEARHYDEGEIVHKGDLLYTIDARPFKAVVAQRKAQLAKAQARLDQAQRNWQRIKHLYEANAVSKAKRSQALSKLETAQAAVELAKANLESAQIKLEYTTVEAPITGVTSLRDVDVGALVQPGTRLTTITQLDPVFLLFALPVDDALARKAALQIAGAGTIEAKKREVKIILPGGETYPVQGEINFVQSTIDPQTGTVQLRAKVPNPDHVLTPGRFIQVRLRIATLKDAVVVPSQAIASGFMQPFVYVVADGKAKKQTVELGPELKEGRVIAKGVSAGDRVIVSGLGSLRPGSPIKIIGDAESNNNGTSSDTADKMASISLQGTSISGKPGVVSLSIQPNSHTA